MNQTVVATPADTVPSTRIVTGNTTFTLSFDFTETLASGDYISSSLLFIGNTSYLNLLSTTYSGAVVSFSLGNNMIEGQQCSVFCSISSALGQQDGRSAILLAYDTGLILSGGQTSTVIISSPTALTPGTIIDGGSVTLSPTISVPGAAVGNYAGISTTTTLPAGVWVKGDVTSSGQVTVQVFNESGSPVTIGSVSFVATVIV